MRETDTRKRAREVIEHQLGKWKLRIPIVNVKSAWAEVTALREKDWTGKENRTIKHWIEESKIRLRVVWKWSTSERPLDCVSKWTTLSS